MVDATQSPRSVGALLGARRGRGKLHWTDVFTYGYLGFGLFLMFAPVVWLVLSSFKTPAGLQEFPPTFLPLGQITAEVEGYDEPLLLFDVTMEDGTVQQLERPPLVAQVIVQQHDESTLPTGISTTTSLRSSHQRAQARQRA